MRKLSAKDLRDVRKQSEANDRMCALAIGRHCEKCPVGIFRRHEVEFSTPCRVAARQMLAIEDPLYLGLIELREKMADGEEII